MIFVFKTSVKTKAEVTQLQPQLDKLLSRSHWNFDLEDCDNILRVDTQPEAFHQTINLLRDHGFLCDELAD